MVSTSFATRADAVRPYLPASFDIPVEPIVTFSRMTYFDVDYLGGRGYHELTVGVSSSFDHSGTSRRGSFMLVVWVDDARAIMVGRELMGYPKLQAELPPVSRTKDGCRYSVSEYGSTLYSAEVGELSAVAGADLIALRDAAEDVTVFGWKHIPGPNGTVDADYPTRISLNFVWAEASWGSATWAIGTPSRREAPHSGRIMSALAGLPVLRHRRALVASGSGSLDRTKVGRLDRAFSRAEAGVTPTGYR
jgi:acetoacetate decarboxylase